MTKRASFQCPDSGLIVVVSLERGAASVAGDEYDWDEMGADDATKQSTREWIAEANRRVKGCRTAEQIEQALKHDVDGSDLDELFQE